MVMRNVSGRFQSAGRHPGRAFVLRSTISNRLFVDVPSEAISNRHHKMTVLVRDLPYDSEESIAQAIISMARRWDDIVAEGVETRAGNFLRDHAWMNAGFCSGKPVHPTVGRTASLAPLLISPLQPAASAALEELNSAGQDGKCGRMTIQRKVIPR